MQACAIFFPIFEAYKSRSEMRNTLDIIKTWDEKRTTSDTSKASTSTRSSSYFSSKRSLAATSEASYGSKEMYKMVSLAKALERNPQPLLHFAATKDFTAENILFLVAVRDWRSAWQRAPKNPATGHITPVARSRLFDHAVEIYAASIHEKYADFPVNIEWRVRDSLDAVFAAAIPDKRKSLTESIVDPFNTEDIEAGGKPKIPAVLLREVSSGSSTSAASDSSTLIISPVVVDTFDELALTPAVVGVTGVGDEKKVPEAFDEAVFDAAEKSVKYLVLTNTWRKFVDSSKEHQALLEGMV